MNAKKRAAMLKAFHAFASRIADRYAEAEECLARGEYEEAQRILSALAVSHAKTSMSLRNVLIRDGVIGGDEK